MNALYKALLACSAWALALDAQAQSSDAWQVSAGAQGFAGDYQESVERATITAAGFTFSAEQPSSGGFSLNYSRNWLDFYAPGADSEENSWFLSGRKYFIDDSNGTLTLRLDGYWVDDSQQAESENDVWAVAPQMSFINGSRTVYFDLGIAYSIYGDSATVRDDLRVVQFTPTLGLGSSSLTDWFQFRGYFILPSNANRAQQQDSAAALEVKYTHWYVDKPLGLYALQAGFVAGERVYAVDHDAAAVYNLADLQTGSMTVSGQWQWFRATNVTTLLGYDQFDNQSIGDSYGRVFFYLGINQTW